MGNSLSDFDQPNYGYFLWTTYNLSTFISSVILGAFTVFGGAWWIRMRYTPNAKAASAKLHLATVWIAWLFTILFYIITAFRSASSAHEWTLGLDSKAAEALSLQIWRLWLTAPAFRAFSTAGWITALLINARIVGTKLPPVQGQVRPSTTMFYPALGMLGCSAVFRGIIVPPYFAHLSGVYSKQDSISTMVEASLFLAASCLMLYSVVAIRKTTHVDGESDPLRKVLMIAVPLWIIYELFRVVIAAFGIALVAIWVPIDISIMLFGLSSLTTILVLPGAIVGAESEKLEA